MKTRLLISVVLCFFTSCSSFENVRNRTLESEKELQLEHYSDRMSGAAQR